MDPKRRSGKDDVETKVFALEIVGTKELKDGREVKEGEEPDEAEFVGNGSVFGVKDLGADILPHGAFTKTLEEKGEVRPLLADHEYKLRSRAGVVYCDQTKDALGVRGVINLEKQFGREVYSDVKHAQKHGIPIGLSIGYSVVKSHYDKEKKARILDEVKLYEVSLTQFPMNEEAGVVDVKDRFAEHLDRLLESGSLNAEYWAIEDARWAAINDALYSDDSPVSERLARMEEDLTQYADALIDWARRWFEFFEEKDTPEDIRQKHEFIRQQIKALPSDQPPTQPETSTEPDTESKEAAPETDPPDNEAVALKHMLESFQTLKQAEA